MRSCERVHVEYEGLANGKIQIGPLPGWMHVNGRVAWYVFQGPYSALPEAWTDFMKKTNSMGPTKLSGPPGDVYVCSPMEHKGDEEKMITILWTPLKQ
jgi:hypothetical protein